MEPNQMRIDVLLVECNRLALIPLMQNERNKDYRELLRYRASLIKECHARIRLANKLGYPTQ